MRAHKLGLFVAWHGAAFERQKRLPSLVDLFRKMEPSRIMSKREVRTTIFAMAEALGATVRRVKKGEA